MTAFEKDAAALPDATGERVTAGDFVRDKDGAIWRVTGVRATERYEAGFKPTGELDHEFSYFQVERPAAGFLQFIDQLVLEPTVQTGVPIGTAELVDGDYVHAFERATIENSHAVLDRIEARVLEKRRELERRTAELRRVTT